MEKYYAVERATPTKDLQHYKYVHKEQKNGKWVYYYKDDMFKDDSIKEVYQKTNGNPSSKYGTYEHGGHAGNPKYTIKVTKGKHLFTEEHTMKDPRSGNATKTRKIGKIEQGTDYVKKQFKKIGKKSIKSLNRHIDRGQKWLNNLFD